MPKNSHHCAGITSSLLYQCPCGFEKICNDVKTSRSVSQRHLRYCAIGKQDKEIDVHIQENVFSCSNSEVKTTILTAPEKIVAKFNKNENKIEKK